MAPRKRIGYWAWREKNQEQPLLGPPPDDGFYHPAKHYDLGEMADQSHQHLTHAVKDAGGDGLYDRGHMSNAAMDEIASCSLQEFCERLGVKPYPQHWPPEIQQAWIVYSAAAANEISHGQADLKPLGWDHRTRQLQAIARKHGRHARKTTGW